MAGSSESLWFDLSTIDMEELLATNPSELPSANPAEQLSDADLVQGLLMNNFGKELDNCNVDWGPQQSGFVPFQFSSSEAASMPFDSPFPVQLTPIMQSGSVSPPQSAALMPMQSSSVSPPQHTALMPMQPVTLMPRENQSASSPSWMPMDSPALIPSQSSTSPPEWNSLMTPASSSLMTPKSNWGMSLEPSSLPNSESSSSLIAKQSSKSSSIESSPFQSTSDSSSSILSSSPYSSVSLSPHPSASLASPLNNDCLDDADEMSNKDKKCRVCRRADAAKYLLYNGRVCNSCKAFFKRAVDSKSYHDFKCVGNGNCKIDSKSWTSCKWCRFGRCLVEAKMCVSMVSNESKAPPPEPKSRKAKSKVKKQNSSSAQTSLINLVAPMLHASIEPLVNGCLQVFRSTSLDAIALLNYNIPLCDLILKFWNDTRPPLENGERDRLEEWNKEYMQLNFRNFDNLISPKITAFDARVLRKANLEAVLSFGWSSFLGEKSLQFSDHDLHLMDVKFEMWKSHLQPIRLNPRILEMNCRLRQSFELQNYDNVYRSSWLPSPELEKQHRALYFEMHNWGLDLGDPQHFLLRRDLVITTLMIMIILFDPCKVKGLRNPEAVAQTYQCYLDALLRYLRTLWPDDTTKVMEAFNGAMKVCRLAREAADIKSQRITDIGF